MSNIVQAEAQRLIEASLGKTTYTAPTGALVVALVTATGSSTAAGTEVTGGSYARQTYTPGSASAATPSVIANTNLISFTGMPACTVTGVDIFDSAGTPRRCYFGNLTASKTVGAGDVLSFAIGALTISLG